MNKKIKTVGLSFSHSTGLVHSSGAAADEPNLQRDGHDESANESTSFLKSLSDDASRQSFQFPSAEITSFRCKVGRLKRRLNSTVSFGLYSPHATTFLDTPIGINTQATYEPKLSAVKKCKIYGWI